MPFRENHTFEVESPSDLEDAINSGEADHHDVFFEHHAIQPTISFEGMPVVKILNGDPRQRFESMFSGGLAYVFFDLVITVFPNVDLVRGQGAFIPRHRLLDSGGVDRLQVTAPVGFTAALSPRSADEGPQWL
jgi:hypothetical protein